MQKILVAGGTGLVGSNLITKLKQKNLKVVLLTTQKNKANSEDIFYWNPALNILPAKALKDVYACINLCGAGIFEKRFTAERKKLLEDSRIESTHLLFRTFKENNIHPEHYLAGSATGFYPNICSDKLTENSTKGNGFISDLVDNWEHAAQQFEVLGSKVYVIRTGIVFSDKGGFLKQLLLPVKYFVGAVPGNGKQIISWIHIDDLSEMMMYLMAQHLTGTYNATASQPESLGTITRQLASVLKRPLWLPNIPEIALKLLFGERYYLILTSQNVSNEKIKQTGFRFQFETSLSAIENLLGK